MLLGKKNCGGERNDGLKENLYLVGPSVAPAARHDVELGVLFGEKKPHVLIIYWTLVYFSPCPTANLILPQACPSLATNKGGRAVQVLN